MKELQFKMRYSYTCKGCDNQIESKGELDMGLIASNKGMIELPQCNKCIIKLKRKGLI